MVRLEPGTCEYLLTIILFIKLKEKNLDEKKNRKIFYLFL